MICYRDVTVKCETVKAHFPFRLCYLRFLLMFKSELFQINFTHLLKKWPKAATSRIPHLRIGSARHQFCPPKTVPHNPTLLCERFHSEANLWRRPEYPLQYFIFQQVHWNTHSKPCLAHTYTVFVSQRDNTLRVVFTLLTGMKTHLQHAVQDARWSSHISTEGDVRLREIFGARSQTVLLLWM